MKKKVEAKDLNKVEGGLYPRYAGYNQYTCRDCGHKWEGKQETKCPECSSTNIKC